MQDQLQQASVKLQQAQASAQEASVAQQERLQQVQRQLQVAQANAQEASSENEVCFCHSNSISTNKKRDIQTTKLNILLYTNFFP